MRSVSVIIPTYNRANYIGITLESFANQTYDRKYYEVVVCDNHSTDGTKQVIDEFILNHPDVKMRYLYEDRQGVHYARNTAALTSSSEILYFTDDDMIASPDLLEKVMQAFDIDDRVAVATGKVIPKWEIDPPKWVEKYLNNQWLSLNDKKETILITSYDNGVYSCHEAVKREIFMATNGFHPENTMGMWIGDGETGLNREIVRMGCLFAYMGESVIQHITPPSRMTQEYLNKRLYNQGTSDMYTEYKDSNGTSQATFWNRIPKLLNKWCHVFWQTIRGKNTLRFCISYCYYFKAQRKFSQRIVNDKNYCDLVSRDDWLR